MDVRAIQSSAKWTLVIKIKKGCCCTFFIIEHMQCRNKIRLTVVQHIIYKGSCSEFIARNNLVAISNAYHHEKVVLFLHPDMVDANAGMSVFRNAKLAVQFATAAHYYVMFADGEAYKTNINPYRKATDAVASFLDRRNAGIIGPRAELEAALASHRDRVRMQQPVFDTHLRMAWTIGTAVKEDSRDTGYAIGNAMRALEVDGDLDRIFTTYNATRVPPPVP